ncbi:uncharacterized protein LOC133824802 [Humulus lupulus]|uniref:uncharacterized protein LOC133824802 n=1 Tax=Humulus lupulus TaxID=3486 RepID=UPI002B4169F6|nr:uncharacterized protein LOC133824802 [Humulus lupulus]
MPLMITRVTFSRFFFTSQFTNNPARNSVRLFSSRSSPATIQIPNSALVDCLIHTYKLTKAQAFAISVPFSSLRSPHKLQSAHKLLLEHGLSEKHIQSVILSSPKILFSDVDKVLRPKLEALGQLGIDGYDLGKFISKNPTVLARSLEKKLVPSIEILKDILGSDAKGKDFMRILRSRWILWADPQRLLANRAFLESCGIVGPQLVSLLKREPRVCLMQESELRELVSRVLDMGVPLGSTMFPHALHAAGGLNKQTLEKRFVLLGNLGFAKEESLEMFRRAPHLLRTSDKKLELGVDFFLNTAKFKRLTLIRSPALLMFSMEGRVIPRYKVFEVLKTKKLFKNGPSFHSMLVYSEAQFLQKFVLKFGDDAAELLAAFRGHMSDSNSHEEEEEEEEEES